MDLLVAGRACCQAPRFGTGVGDVALFVDEEEVRVLERVIGYRIVLNAMG